MNRVRSRKEDFGSLTNTKTWNAQVTSRRHGLDNNRGN